MTSSVLDALVYEEKNGRLLAKFKTFGRCWEYWKVSAIEASSLVNSGSHGTYFNDFIKGNFGENQVPATLFDDAFEKITALIKPLLIVKIDWATLAGDGSIPVFPR